MLMPMALCRNVAAVGPPSANEPDQPTAARAARIDRLFSVSSFLLRPSAYDLIWTWAVTESNPISTRGVVVHTPLTPKLTIQPVSHLRSDPPVPAHTAHSASTAPLPPTRPPKRGIIIIHMHKRIEDHLVVEYHMEMSWWCQSSGIYLQRMKA